MHDVVIVGIPLIAILAGILFSRSDNKETRTELKGEIKDLRNEMREELRAIRTEMKDVRAEAKEFRAEVNNHLGRIVPTCASSTT